MYSIFNVRYKTGRDYKVPLWIFFATVRLFSKFFFVPKGSPLRVFWCFATNWVFKKSKGSPLLQFWKLCAFWALDITPTLDVPVLFHLRYVKFELKRRGDRKKVTFQKSIHNTKKDHYLKQQSFSSFCVFFEGNGFGNFDWLHCTWRRLMKQSYWKIDSYFHIRRRHCTWKS